MTMLQLGYVLLHNEAEVIRQLFSFGDHPCKQITLGLGPVGEEVTHMKGIVRLISGFADSAFSNGLTTQSRSLCNTVLMRSHFAQRTQTTYSISL